MISPTGSTEIRMDSMGSGMYGAYRGDRRHMGVDYIVKKGGIIRAPIYGLAVRMAKPYANEKYEGLVIRGDSMTVKLFYFRPYINLIGNYIAQGEIIGVAQDISEKYGEKMKPHIHLEIESIDPNIFIREL